MNTSAPAEVCKSADFSNVGGIVGALARAMAERRKALGYSDDESDLAPDYDVSGSWNEH